MRKKGQIEDFGVYLFVVIALVIIGVFLLLVVNAKINNKVQKFEQDLSFTTGFYSTRVILNHEIRPGYHVYDFVRDTVASGDYDNFRKSSIEFIKAYDPKGVSKFWDVAINNHCYTIPAGTSCDATALKNIPRVTVPNPSGDNIQVLFKPHAEIDGENIQRVAYGYKAGQLKGYNPDEVPTFSMDGKDLAKIENIPNIICDPSTSTVGMICAANPELVARLHDISEGYLVPNGITMKFTQAYRTYEIQKTLYDQNCNSGTCAPDTCNPGPNPSNPHLCPHMVSGAIDIYFCKDGKNMNYYEPQTVEDVMCGYGFVRYINEAWHFEYGTSQWENAMTKRANGEEACTYGQLRNYRKNREGGC